MAPCSMPRKTSLDDVEEPSQVFRESREVFGSNMCLNK